MAGDARLFVLATIARLGEAHGHEVTREAAVDHTENWAHVTQGALYSALRRCEADQLIELVRTEQVGKFPARTVYRVTPAGHDVLARSRSEAWRRVEIPPDSFDLALSVADGQDPTELKGAIEHRLHTYRQVLAGLLEDFGNRRARLEPTAIAVFEHVIMRHETEIAWHRRLLEQVDTFDTPRPRGNGSDESHGSDGESRGQPR